MKPGAVAFDRLPVAPPVTREELSYARDRPGRLILEEALRHGSVTVAGKSDEEIAAELILHLREFRVGRGVEIDLIMDHTPDVLGTAKALARDGNELSACVLYATWLEHRLNWIVLTTASRRGLDSHSVSQMLRDVGFRAKATWLLELLALPKLPEDLFTCADRLVEARNRLVHYKWKPLTSDDDDAQAEVREVIAAFDAAVPELERYESEALEDEAQVLVERLFGPSSVGA